MNILVLANTKSPHLDSWIYFYKRLPNIKFTFLVTGDFKGFSEKNKAINFIFLDFSNKNFIQTIIETRKILSRHSSFNIDFLHCHSAGYLGLLALFINFKRTIITTYGSEVYRVNNSTRFYKIIIKKILKHSYKITTSSSDMKEFIIENLNIKKEKISSFTLGINNGVFKKGYFDEITELEKDYGFSKNKHDIYISNRRLLPLYNIDNIILAFDEFNAKTSPDSKLIVLRGDSDDEEYISRILTLIDGLKSKENIIYVNDFLSPKKLAALYNFSDFSISMPDSDQLSTSILESMACGCIPLLNNLSSYKELLEKANVIEVHNPKSITNVKEGFVKSILLENIEKDNAQFLESFTDERLILSKINNLFN